MNEKDEKPTGPLIPPDRAPQTPNEWGVLVILSFFFALFIFLELAQDFSVAKLSVPFFLISWVILLVLHEFGHALMAKMLGWQILLVSIGHGVVRARLAVFDTPVEFRTLPLSGFVLPRPGNLVAPRLKQFLIYAAGPGIELVAVAIIVSLIGPDAMLSRSPEVWLIAAQSFCVAALFGAIFNLIPFPHQTAEGTAWSDGLGMIRCWRIPDEEFRKRMEGVE
jgi:Zn-dependent protease